MIRGLARKLNKNLLYRVLEQFLLIIFKVSVMLVADSVTVLFMSFQSYQTSCTFLTDTLHLVFMNAQHHKHSVVVSGGCHVA
jgi:hypothetical protein